MSDMFVGSQTPMYQNVCIRRRAKSGKIIEERYAKNRITRLMLYGIARFLCGHFNQSSPDKIYEHIPRYLALGTNVPGADASQTDVGITSSVNDTRLLNEIKYATVNGGTEAIKRIWIAERNMCTINTKFSDPFIKVSIQAYINSDAYNGISIGEAGLFSKEKDNNCLARVCFSPIKKQAEEVLDIRWDITLLSYGETKYPDSLTIENGTKVTIPLKYTNKYFKQIPLHLYLSINGDIDYINPNDESKSIYGLFTYINLEDHDYKTSYNLKETDWYIYIKNIGLENIFDILVNHLTTSKKQRDLNGYYLQSYQNIPTMIHFSNLYLSDVSDNIPSNELSITLLYSEDKTYTYEDTNWEYYENDEKTGYTIYDDTRNSNIYKVINNRFYKKDSGAESGWVETNYFMYNGAIVDINQKDYGYSYKNNKFYKVTTNITQSFSNQYLNYAGIVNPNYKELDLNFLHLFSINNLNIISRTGYSVNINDKNKIYYNGEYTSYHISNDEYWIMSDYVKLIPIITPADATDKSITWIIQNQNIATINFDGVVTGWNIGETMAIASTSNDLQAKCIVEVVKDSTYIPVDELTLDPEEVTLVANKDINQEVIVSAIVNPLFATNSTVVWSLSSELKNAITMVNLGGNKVRLTVNGSETVATGYLSASTQSGKYANCLVRVIYESDDKTCDDESHLLQKI